MKNVLNKYEKIDKRRKVVSIGGGFLLDPRRGVIDDRIVELTGKDNPNALIIPTATSDCLYTVDSFDEAYGDDRGCNVDHLLLLTRLYSKKELEKRILGADLIYVSGGNTLGMMYVWQKLGVDKLLRQAWENGTVMTGMSAGSICWLKYGHSDSLAYYHDVDEFAYIRVQCLGLVDVFGCPHYTGEYRQSDFAEMIEDQGLNPAPGMMGVGIDDLCAMEFIDDEYRVLAGTREAKSYKVWRDPFGEVHRHALRKTRKMQPISRLKEIPKFPPRKKVKKVKKKNKRRKK